MNYTKQEYQHKKLETLSKFSPEFLKDDVFLNPVTGKIIECLVHGMNPYTAIEHLVKIINSQQKKMQELIMLMPGPPIMIDSEKFNEIIKNTQNERE